MIFEVGSFGNCGICGMFRRDGAETFRGRVAKKGVLRGSFGLRRLRDAPPKGFNVSKHKKIQNYTILC